MCPMADACARWLIAMCPIADAMCPMADACARWLIAMCPVADAICPIADLFLTAPMKS
jgi:hypothetical protein